MATIAHPERYGTKGRVIPPRLAVLHTSEGGEGEASAEQLVSFIMRPPTVYPDGRRNVASYHDVADTDRVIPVVEHHFVAYSAPGANHDGIHLCIPGRAGQTREQWLDPTSSRYIDWAAKWLVNNSLAYGRDYTRRLTVAEVRGGLTGYCDHWTISQAYGKSDHWDVGPSFPFDELDRRIAGLKNPIPPFSPQHGQFSLWPLVPDKRTIGGGAKGDEVRYAQGVLKFRAAQPVEVTGEYDQRTIDAVWALQQYFRVVDVFPGAIGPQTWKVIDYLAANNG